MDEFWKNQKLKNSCYVLSGFAFKSDDFIDEGIPVIKIANINDYTIKKSSDDSFIQESKFADFEDYILNEYDIVIALSGNTTCKMGRVNEEFTPSLLNQRVGCFRLLKEDELDYDFLYFLLISENYQNKLWVYATATGQPNLSPRDIGKLDLPNPHLPEQRAIASVLSKVDDAIHAVKNTIEKAERLKKALMQNLLTGKLKPNGTRRTDDEFYTDEKFGKVPKGWEVKFVKQLCERRNESFEPSQTNEILDYIGLEHIISDKYRISGSGKSSDTKSTKLKFYEGDLLYGKLRPYLNKIWIAQFAGVCSTDIIVLESQNFSDWLYFNLQTVKFLNYTQSVTAGTQHPRARWKDICRFQVICPTDENVKIEIENSLNSLEAVFDDKTNKIQKLERLKKALMQNLLTGKKRLKAEYIQGFV